MIDKSLQILDDLRNLSVRYAQAADRRDTATFVSVFHPDATLTVRGPDSSEAAKELRGHHQLSLVPGALDRYVKTYHFVGQSHYDVGDDEANGEIYCIANHLQVSGGNTTNEIMYIRYRDEYSRDREVQWKIATRHVLVDWIETRRVGL